MSTRKVKQEKLTHVTKEAALRNDACRGAQVMAHFSNTRIFVIIRWAASKERMLTEKGNKRKWPEMDLGASHQHVQYIVWYYGRQPTQQQELPAFRLNGPVHL